MNQKHCIYGSGMHGCLYDYGPHCSETIEEAVEGLIFIFADSISANECSEMRDNLKNSGYHSFSNPKETGAHYAEISESNGPMPENDDE